MKTWFTEKCPYCGRWITASTEQQIDKKLLAHIQSKHPEALK